MIGRRLIVGLTGGIGSGKSAAADVFARLGAGVIDSDRIAHEMTGPHGPAMSSIAAEFGPGVVAADGSLDRPAMRRRAFADAAVRRRLEAILHPLIGAEADRRTAEAMRSGVPYVVQVVPLLIESADYRRRVDRVLVIDAAEERCVARVMARSGLSQAEVEAVMAAQTSRRERLAAADDIVDNGGSLAELDSKIEGLHRRYLDLAGSRQDWPIGDKL